MDQHDVHLLAQIGEVWLLAHEVRGGLCTSVNHVLG